MSGFDYRKEEWTRRKSYLLRSLFEDDPMLSTISEEDESGVQYSPKSPSGHYRTRQSETRHRSPSPLPDLVIEVVPRRPKIYDDEPEEFYKRLEKQMRKLYRRDYLNLPSSSSDSTEPQSDNEFHTYVEDNCVRNSIDQEKSIEDDQNMNLLPEDEVLYITEPHGLSTITEESTIEKSTSSISIEIGANQIETTAIIEKEMEESDEDNNESIHTGEESTVQSSAETEESSMKEESEDEREEEPTELAENNGSSDSTEPQSDNEFHTYVEDNCVRNSIDQEKSIEDDQNMNLLPEDEVLYITEPHGLSTITEESTIEKSTSSISIEIGANQIETTAIIEKEMEESDEDNNESIHTGEESTVQSSAETEESSMKEESEDEREEEPTELAENNDASLDNESVSPILEPDAMRRQETRSSQFSIGNDFEKSTEKIVPYRRKQLEFMEDSLENRDPNIIPRNTDITGKTTSTPNSSHKSYTRRISRRKSFGDRFEPYSSSSGKSFVSKYDQALQTSFSEEETSNQEFWRNFIVGTPIIYMFK